MAQVANTVSAGRGNALRIGLWALAAGLVLLPLVAMQFTREVNWTAEDFVFAAVMIGGVGLLVELTVRRSRNFAYRAGALAALAAGFMTIWANAAVGMIGDEDNLYNLFFLGIVAAVLLGGFLVRFRASGMARVTGLAAVAQLAVSLAGLSADWRGGIFAAGFAAIWLVSAALFAKAAKDER